MFLGPVMEIEKYTIGHRGRWDRSSRALWVRGSDFNYKWKSLGHFKLCLHFKRLPWMLWGMSRRDDREKARKENLWRTLQEARWTYEWFRQG